MASASTSLRAARHTLLSTPRRLSACTGVTNVRGVNVRCVNRRSANKTAAPCHNVTNERAVGHHRDVVQGSLHQPHRNASVRLRDLALSSSSFRQLLKTTWLTSIQHTQRSRDAYDSALYKLYIDIWRGVAAFCIGSPVPLSQVEFCIFLHCISHTCIDSAEKG